MAIIDARMKQKRGHLAQLDKNKLLPGEFAIPDDSDKIYICIAAGVVLEIPSVQSMQNLLDTLNTIVAHGEQIISDFEKLEVDKAGIDDNNVSTLTTFSSAKISESIQEADSADNSVTFDSSDSDTELSWTDVPVLVSNEKHKSIFNKISIMFKNIRYLYKKITEMDIEGDNYKSNLKSGIVPVNGLRDAGKEITVTFSNPMPNADYSLVMGISYGSYFNNVYMGVSTKRADGFKFRIGTNANTDVSDITYIVQWILLPHNS